MDGSQAVVVRKMEHYNVQYKGRMGCLDFVFGSEFNGNAILPLFELFIKISDGVQQFAVRLFRCFGGIESLVHSAFNDGKAAHGSEQVELGTVR